MAATPITPQPGAVSLVTTGGTAVNAALAAPNGGFIVNPYTATDQGISEPEPIYINPVATAGLEGNGTTFALQPGQKWDLIPGQTTVTSVNAETSGHKFSIVVW